MTRIASLDDLKAIYGEPKEAALVKQTDHITEEYRRLIEASPFFALATVGPEGLDCSPRGDAGRAVTVRDEKTLLIPDRIGNNRVDSLANIVRDERIALLFLIPGSNTTMRCNGRAVLSVDPDLLAEFAVEGKPPRSVIIVTVEAVYFQCARAVLRAGLWDPVRQIDPKTLPSAGEILAAVSGNRVGGEAYDKEWPERARKSLW